MGAIVLDKCFLQAATWQKVCSLADEHDLILTGSLFYELLSGSDSARARVFSKLPRRDNPAHLLDNLTSLLGHEDKHHTPALNVLDHTISISYRFNPSLRAQEYELPQDAREALGENEQTTRKLVHSYVERTNAVVEMFHRVTSGSDNSRLSALAEIEKEISLPSSVLTFYGSIGDPKLPPIELLTPHWTTFRFYQTSLLFSLHTIHRHRGPIPKPLSDREFERLEHDVHDAVTLCAGIVAGGLATEERKLQHWWRLLHPQGLLVSSQ